MNPHYAGSGIDTPEDRRRKIVPQAGLLPALILLPVALVAIVAIVGFSYRA